ncbi:hypothetical protein [Streptomyces sp. NPDC042319]|uniref:hypothetical protein n=1 Tax=Streptomyces sp. NPDC042319 TaxID=3154332 RepID=UPI00340AEEAB
MHRHHHSRVVAAAATAQDGEVIAYAPRRENGRLVVPLTVTTKAPGPADLLVTSKVNKAIGRYQ